MTDGTRSDRSFVAGSIRALWFVPLFVLLLVPLFALLLVQVLSSEARSRAILAVVFGLVAGAVLLPVLLATIFRRWRLGALAVQLDIARRTQEFSARGAEPQYLTPLEAPSPPPQLFGREAELQYIQAYVEQSSAGTSTPSDTPTTVLLWGNAGVGKTALASSFVTRFARDFPGGQLFYTPNSNESAPTESALRFFIRALLGPAGRVATTPRELVKQYAEITRARRILVCIDNVYDGDWLAALTPSGPQSVLIATSRVNLPSAVGLRIELQPLPTPAGIRLLSSLIGDERTRVDGDTYSRDAAEIVESSGGIPLAVKLIAQSLCVRPHLALSVAVERLSELRETRGAAVLSNGGSLDLIYSLMRGPERRGLRAIGLLGDRRKVYPWMLAALTETDESSGAALASRLSSEGLLSHAGGTADRDKCYAVSDLVASYAELRLKVDEHLVDVPSVEKLLAEWRTRRDEVAGTFRDTRGQAFHEYQSGNFVEAFNLVSRAITDASESGDEESKNLAIVASAEIHAELGGVDDAWDLAIEVIKSGPPSAECRAWRVLGKLCRRSRQTKRARQHLVRALRVARRAADAAEEFRVCRELVILGSISSRRFPTNRAARRSHQLITQNRRIAAEGMPGLLWAESQVLSSRGRHANAIAKLQEALRLASRDGYRLWEAWTNYSLGVETAVSGSFDQAQQYLERATQQFGSMAHRYGVAHCQLASGRLYLGVGNPARAQPLLEEAVETFKTCGDLWVEAQALEELAQSYVVGGELDNAFGLVNIAAAAYRRLGDPVHAWRIESSAARNWPGQRNRRERTSTDRTPSRAASNW